MINRPRRPKNMLPAKYNDETKSGFTYTVKKGQNTVELKMD